MLKLRRASVLEAGAADGPEQSLAVALVGSDGESGEGGERGAAARRRPAIADVTLVGACEVGDEVIVNVQARDLGLGSGGFDVVHVNLTRGLRGEGTHGAAVMKLNYTSLQHAVAPVEELEQRESHGAGARPIRRPVGVLALHGQLPAVAWGFAQEARGARLGYVQTTGGALPGGHSRAVRELRGRGLLAGHITAGSAFGGEGEAVTTAGALDYGLSRLGWDAAVCGPGPGIVGSNSRLGHGGMAALDSAHAALALGFETLLVARMSGAERRERHRGLSHHTRTVLELLLGRVVVAFPEYDADHPSLDESALDARARERADRHDWRAVAVDLGPFVASGLATATMGRGVEEDPLFFAAALAGGHALAQLMARSGV